MALTSAQAKAAKESANPQKSAGDAKSTFLSAASGAGVRLFLCGFLILFLELSLIRFLSGNVWNLGYFPNLVLLAAFVGLGAGFLMHERILDTRGVSHFWFAAAPMLTLALVLIVYWLRPGVPGFESAEVGWSGASGWEGELFWTVGNKHTNAHWLLFALWFLVTAAIFALIAQFTAKTFRLFSPLTAYSLDIGGSLAGIVAFMIASFLQVAAAWWFAFSALLWAGAFLFGGGGRMQWLAAGIICLVLTAALVRQHDLFDPQLRGESQWSPYQKVTYRPDSRLVYVNNINHQAMHDEKTIREWFYSFIYKQRKETNLPPYKRVMVIGAGNGNDVVAALVHDAEYVHAIEIDPVILELGQKHHPERPYDSKRVVRTVDDGRHALFTEDNKYDLIIFALTDSLAKASAISQLRLENYLFTEESVRRAWQLLNDDGTVMMYNFYRREWLVQKLVALMQTATGEKAERKKVTGHTVIWSTKSGNPAPPTELKWEIPTDNWPFLYLRERSVPHQYLVAMLALAVMIGTSLFFAIPKSSRRQKNKQRHGDNTRLRLRLAFIATGGAFLLLETKSVIQFSLLFGTTWFTAAIVFFGALSLVLLANWTAQLIKTPRLGIVAFILLWLSCLAVIAYPPSNLIWWESATARAVAASVLVFTPIFFANLVFAVLFRGRDEPEKYFGWNLLGGTLGGVAEYSGMAVGYHILAWIVPIVYIMAFVCVWPEMRSSLSPPPRKNRRA